MVLLFLFGEESGIVNELLKMVAQDAMHFCVGMLAVCAYGYICCTICQGLEGLVKLIGNKICACRRVKAMRDEDAQKNIA